MIQDWPPDCLSTVVASLPLFLGMLNSASAKSNSAVLSGLSHLLVSPSSRSPAFLSAVAKTELVQSLAQSLRLCFSDSSAQFANEAPAHVLQLLLTLSLISPPTTIPMLEHGVVSLLCGLRALRVDDVVVDLVRLCCILLPRHPLFQSRLNCSLHIRSQNPSCCLCFLFFLYRCDHLSITGSVLSGSHSRGTRSRSRSPAERKKESSTSQGSGFLDSNVMVTRRDVATGWASSNPTDAGAALSPAMFSSSSSSLLPHQAVCPQLHLLVPFSTPHGRFTCDLCRSTARFALTRFLVLLTFLLFIFFANALYHSVIRAITNTFKHAQTRDLTGGEAWGECAC